MYIYPRAIGKQANEVGLERERKSLGGRLMLVTGKLIVYDDVLAIQAVNIFVLIQKCEFRTKSGFESEYVG